GRTKRVGMQKKRPTFCLPSAAFMGPRLKGFFRPPNCWVQQGRFKKARDRSGDGPSPAKATLVEKPPGTGRPRSLLDSAPGLRFLPGLMGLLCFQCPAASNPPGVDLQTPKPGDHTLHILSPTC